MALKFLLSPYSTHAFSHKDSPYRRKGIYAMTGYQNGESVSLLYFSVVVQRENSLCMWRPFSYPGLSSIVTA